MLPGKKPEHENRRIDQAVHVPISEIELKKRRLYQEGLGITLAHNADADLFTWFFASVLVGARMSETIARNTYRSFA